jgi:hypothetical protein
MDYLDSDLIKAIAACSDLIRSGMLVAVVVLAGMQAPPRWWKNNEKRIIWAESKESSHDYADELRSRPGGDQH